MPSPISTAMLNWIKGWTAIKKGPTTREDMVAQWGDLGGAVYDWAANAYKSGMMDTYGANLDPGDTQMVLDAVDSLQSQYPVGGTVGKVYAPPPGGGGTVQPTYGGLADRMLAYMKQLYDERGQYASFRRPGDEVTEERAAMVKAFGELGGKAYDYARQNSLIGLATLDPNQKAQFTQIVENIAPGTPPGGTMGGAYNLPPTEEARLNQVKIDQVKAQMDQAAKQLALNTSLNDAQIAQINASIANADATLKNTLNLTTAQIAQLNASIANMAGMLANNTALTTAQIRQIDASIQLAKDTLAETTRANKAAEATSRAGVTGWILNDKGEWVPTLEREKTAAELAANPRDWIRSWYFNQGQDPSKAVQVTQGTGPSVYVPPWLAAMATNKPQPEFQGGQPGLGDFPIKPPEPGTVSAKTWQSLLPSEQEGAAGLASSGGWYVPDYIDRMRRSWTVGKGISSEPAMWGGF